MRSAKPDSIEQEKLQRRVRIATYCGMNPDPCSWDDDEITLLDKLDDIAQQRGMEYMYRYAMDLFGRNRN
ncbi:MAG: hypothetical protein ACR2PA_16820 [Hyphomicrobiaceae bacterium]